MLAELGLVHMNGRVYDPQVARVVSPDIIVSDAADAQSWNAYSYVANTPLNATDPSGWCTDVAPHVPGVIVLDCIDLSGGYGSGGWGWGSGYGWGWIGWDWGYSGFAGGCCGGIDLAYSVPTAGTVASGVSGVTVGPDVLANYFTIHALPGLSGGDEIPKATADRSRNVPHAAESSSAYQYAQGIALAGVGVAAGFLPPVGEVMDFGVMVAPDSLWWERGIAAVSLGASILTAGAAPNFGAAARA